MKKVHISQCPVCDSKVIKNFLHGKDFFASQESFDIQKCQTCGFLFTQDFPDEENIGSYYESPEYISHSDSQKGFTNSIYHKVRSRMLKRKAHLVENQTSQKGSLLDIGTGTGYFANEMKEREWDVFAIEKNPQARQFIRDNWNIDALNDEMLYDLALNSFDAVTLWHVLEHLEHLNKVMKQLHAILKDDGTLVVALPNADSYDAYWYKEYWAAYDLPRHLWHFCPKTFEQLAARHGFEIVKTKRMPFDVFYVSILSEKYRKKSFGFIRALFRGFIGWTVSLFYKNASSSLIYVLKKTNKQS